MNTVVFLFKLLLTPLIVLAATLVARRWGESIGGLFIALPLTSGPVSVFLAIQQGRPFAAAAANSAMLGLIPVTAFYIAYVVSARRLPWYWSALTSIFCYSAVVAGISFQSIQPWLTALLVPLVLLATVLALGKRIGAGPLLAPPRWDLPARMVLATALVILITTAATTLGPLWSGLLSPFPIFTFVMVTFSQRQGGVAAVRRFIQGVSRGLFSYVAFFLVVRGLVQGTNLLLVYALATLVALLVNGAFLAVQILRRPPVTP